MAVFTTFEKIHIKDTWKPSTNQNPSFLILRPVERDGIDRYEMIAPYCIQLWSEDALRDLYHDLGVLGKSLGWEKDTHDIAVPPV